MYFGVWSNMVVFSTFNLENVTWKSECKFYLAYIVLYIIWMMIPPPPCNLCVSFLLAALSRLCIFLPAFLTCSSLYEKKRGINIVLRKMFYIEVANYLMATRCFFSPLFSPLSVIIILQNKKEISHYLPSRLVPSTFLLKNNIRAYFTWEKCFLYYR